MIKPILYHDIREKNKIEAELLLKTPDQKRHRLLRSGALMDTFANLPRPTAHDDHSHPLQAEKNVIL